jgi:hypothetical protein
MGGLFTLAHSDWFQLLFEGGYIGFYLGLWLVVDAFRRASLWIQCSLAAIFVAALGNMPLHFWPSALASAAIFAEALDRAD